MPRTDTATRLVLIEESLARIELAHASRVPVAEVKRAIEDVFATYGIVTQLKEVYDFQRGQLIVLTGLATQLISETKEGDQELRDLLIQLRELGRNHVRGLADLERAHGEHERETERRGSGWRIGDVDRRRAG